MRKSAKFFRFFALSLLLAGTASSCVEDMPGEGGNDGFEAKLPFPDSHFSAGDEILIKGSGLMPGDRIFVQAVLDETWEEDDLDNNGREELTEYSPKVEARISRISDNELAFIVPAEMDTSDYMAQHNIVFLQHDGQEYKLGLYYYSHTYFQVSLNQDFTMYVSFSDSSNTLFFLSYFDIDPNTNEIIPKGDRYPIEMETFSARCTSGIGNMIAIAQRNGEEILMQSPDGNPQSTVLYFNPYQLVYLDEYSYAPNIYLQWAGFTDTDSILLRDAYTGETVEAFIESRDSQGILISSSAGGGASYNVVLQRNGGIEIELGSVYIR